MNTPRFVHLGADTDESLVMAPAAFPEADCEIPRNSDSPIRLLPSALFEGSSDETDRILYTWRPRIANIVEQSIGMARDLCIISWQLEEEPYPCCPFLKVINPPSPGKDMRRFTDEACHILLQVLTRDEIVELAHWPDHRKPDARDMLEWIERWGTWLPDEEGQFRLWSAFLPCEALEAFCRYVHALVHDFYLEILELHREWEADPNRVRPSEPGSLLENDPGLPYPGYHPVEFEFYAPRLLIGDREIWIDASNAVVMREWGMRAFIAWKSLLDEEKKEQLYDLIHAADELCPDPQFQ